MKNPFKKELTDILLNGSKEERIFLCGKSLPYFALYHFSEMFAYKPAPVHYDMYEDFERAASFINNEVHHQTQAESYLKGLSPEIDTIIWTAHRGLGKTSIAKVAILWGIVYKKFNFLVYAAYNAENARAVLFDVVNELTTNKTIIADYGELFTTPTEENDQSLDVLDKRMGKRTTKKKKMKRATSFITENGIKVLAYSTMQSLRGLLFNNNRPDMLVVDDFETNETRHSQALTARVRDFLNEAKTALAPKAVKLFLTNYITEDGNVAALHELYRNNQRAIVRNIPLYWRDKESGELTLSWPAKYTFTAQEATDYNSKQLDAKKHKVSVEQLRADYGEMVFEVEMMNNPSSHDSKLFMKSTIEKARAMAKMFMQIASLGTVKIYEKFIPGHAYGVGVDVGSGTGGDASAIVVIDFSATPQKVVASWADNRTPPMQLAYLCAKVGETYGNAVIAVENNGLGLGVVQRLAEIYQNLYVTKRKNAYGVEDTITLGFTSSGGKNGSKQAVVYQFQEAVMNDKLIICDPELIDEMEIVRDNDFGKVATAKEIGTRHLDKFIAACLAYETKQSAYASEPSSVVSNVDDEDEVELSRRPMAGHAGFTLSSLDVYR